MRDVRAVPGDRIEVLYHAIPPEQLLASSQVDRVGARRQLGIGSEFLFAAITKLGPDRGNEVMLAAFAKARQRIPGARLAIVYKPTLYHRIPKEYEGIDWARNPEQMIKRVKDLISQLGLQDAVRLVDALEHPELYYAASDVLVAPFEKARFSSVNLVEAMAYGRPHIVTDIGEPAELVHRYQSGMMVPVGDIAKLADAMVLLATDPARLALLSANARKGSADLTVDAAAARLSRIYEGLLPLTSTEAHAELA